MTGDMTRRFVVVVEREKRAAAHGITRAGRVAFRTADSNYTFKLYDVMVSSSCEQKFKGREAGEMKGGRVLPSDCDEPSSRVAGPMAGFTVAESARGEIQLARAFARDDGCYRARIYLSRCEDADLVRWTWVIFD